MKTRLLALLLIVTAAGSAVAETYTAPITRPRSKPRERPAPPVTQTEVDGVIPRGIRGGNFFQMFNPRAPRKYGTSQEAISYDPSPMNVNTRHDESGKWRGIKLFVFRF
jgi:hypothetical protein